MTSVQRRVGKTTTRQSACSSPSSTETAVRRLRYRVAQSDSDHGRALAWSTTSSTSSTGDLHPETASIKDQPSICRCWQPADWRTRTPWTRTAAKAHQTNCGDVRHRHRDSPAASNGRLTAMYFAADRAVVGHPEVSLGARLRSRVGIMRRGPVRQPRSIRWLTAVADRAEGDDEWPMSERFSASGHRRDSEAPEVLV